MWIERVADNHGITFTRYCLDAETDNRLAFIGWALNGRFSYVANHRGFVEIELATGTNFIGNLQTQQILSFGDASAVQVLP